MMRLRSASAPSPTAIASSSAGHSARSCTYALDDYHDDPAFVDAELACSQDPHGPHVCCRTRDPQQHCMHACMRGGLTSSTLQLPPSTRRVQASGWQGMRAHPELQQ
jgi:hypothetical protein